MARILEVEKQKAVWKCKTYKMLPLAAPVLRERDLPRPAMMFVGVDGRNERVCKCA
jgi:hypothetical protein